MEKVSTVLPDFEITRKCLEVFLKYKHPVRIITKNALILRDLDLLKELAKDNLIGVNISITSLSEDTRRILEPRTTTIKKRWCPSILMKEVRGTIKRSMFQGTELRSDQIKEAEP